MPVRFVFYGFCIYAFAAGAMLPLQTSVNINLARGLGHPVLAALVSFMVGTLALLIYSLVLGLRWPTFAEMSTIPMWMWLGGLCGAFYVASIVLLAPRIGIATSVGLLIAGQMIASLLFDHYGWLGMPQKSLTLVRAFGAGLLMLGVFLIRRG